MKGIMFLILTICIFYVGGMYHCRGLLILAFVQGEFLLMGVLQVLYCKRKLMLHFRQMDKDIILGQSVGSAEIEDKGRIPVSCFQLELICDYQTTNIQEKYKVYGSIERGKSVQRLDVCARHCGILTIYMRQIVVYDYLLLWSGKKKMREERTVVVFPEETMLDLHKIYEETENSIEEWQRNIIPDYQTQEEIRQIREYQEGDQLSFVHWKLSARTDSLCVKEYEDKKNSCITLFLNFTDFSEKSAREQDAFYSVLAAFLLAFLHRGITTSVHWENEDQVVRMEVSSKEQYLDLLYQLYREDFPKKEKIYAPKNEGFCLDDRRRLYYQKKMINKFDMVNLEKELEGNE